MQQTQYDKLTDEEIVQRLMATPTENKLHEYFFCKKCYNFLQYISQTLYNEETIYHLTGEFYEFLSKDNWYVLRKWKKQNNCSLYTYLSRCAINHFTSLVKADKLRSEMEFIPSSPEFIDYLNSLVAEEPETEHQTWQAFNMLKERDQLVLRLMIIEERSAMQAAPEIWKYLNCEESYENLPAKKVQNTIATIKHRALVAMFNNLNKLKGI
jgi:hypothetical protein